MPPVGSTPHIVNLPDGSEIRLFRITPADWIKFSDRFRTVRKAREMQTLALTGVSGEELRAELRKYDAKKLRHHDVIQWVTEMDGAAELLALSVSHGWEVWRNGEKAETIEAKERKVADIPQEIPYVDYIDHAAGVGNLKLTYTDEDKPDPKNESRQAIGTGGEKPTESEYGSDAQTTP